MAPRARGGKRKQGKRKGYKKGGLHTKGKGNRVNDIASVSETFLFDAMSMNVIYADYGCLS